MVAPIQLNIMTIYIARMGRWLIYHEYVAIFVVADHLYVHCMYIRYCTHVLHTSTCCIACYDNYLRLHLTYVYTVHVQCVVLHSSVPECWIVYSNNCRRSPLAKYQLMTVFAITKTCRILKKHQHFENMMSLFSVNVKIRKSIGFSDLMISYRRSHSYHYNNDNILLNSINHISSYCVDVPLPEYVRGQRYRNYNNG